MLQESNTCIDRSHERTKVVWKNNVAWQRCMDIQKYNIELAGMAYWGGVVVWLGKIGSGLCHG